MTSDSDKNVPPRGGIRQSRRIAIAEIRHPILRKAFEAWNQLKGARTFPSRSDMSPRHLGPILRNTVLIRVVDGGADFELRIVGDAIVQMQPILYPGLTMKKLESERPHYAGILAGLYRYVHEAGIPDAYRGWYEHAGEALAFYHESLHLPLGPDGATVDHILGITVQGAGPDELFS